MQEEVTQKTIAFSIKSAKLTAQVLQAAARKFLEARNKGKTKLHHGQQSLKQLKKHGAALCGLVLFCRAETYGRRRAGAEQRLGAAAV